MIDLDPKGTLTSIFVWCCDHLPLTVTRDYSEDKRDGIRRTGAHYIEHGTTLCHIFWAILWMPILWAAAVAFIIFMIVMIHVAGYRDHGETMGVAAYFIPEMAAAGIGSLAGVVILVTIAASKGGLLNLIWEYLKGMKSRVCPLVVFNRT